MRSSILSIIAMSILRIQQIASMTLRQRAEPSKLRSDTTQMRSAKA